MELAPLSIRTLAEADVEEFLHVTEGAFLHDPHPEDLAVYRDLVEPERFHALFDGDTLVGGGGVLSRTMTLPGSKPTPVAAVSTVGIAPDQRRRGGLRTLMRTQLHTLHEAGAEPVAVLWASEGGIYGRFGYAVAARRARLAVPHGTAYRAGVPTGRVRLLDAEAAAPVLRQIYPRVAPRHVGWISRPEIAWRTWLHDPEHHRHGASAYRFAVTDDGYAVFRTKAGGDDRGPRFKIQVHELVPATPFAHATLWRFLLDLDFGAEVVHCNVAVDDPLPLLLVNPRAAVLTLSDCLWVRLVDVDHALAARHYAAPCDLVLDLTDALCPWNAGRWRLKVGTDGTAQVRRTDAGADLRCDTTELAATYLGDTRWTALAAAGRITELRPGAVLAASRSFTADAAPHCPEVF
ncbi:MAG: GNAT family N-acetyltransferase [Actinomycetota bacterium]|nr:GNAT family N-acetyltransferase [Actinomycetota bacterium]